MSGINNQSQYSIQPEGVQQHYRVDYDAKAGQHKLYIGNKACVVKQSGNIVTDEKELRKIADLFTSTLKEEKIGKGEKWELGSEGVTKMKGGTKTGTVTLVNKELYKASIQPFLKTAASTNEAAKSVLGNESPKQEESPQKTKQPPIELPDEAEPRDDAKTEANRESPPPIPSTKPKLPPHPQSPAQGKKEVRDEEKTEEAPSAPPPLPPRKPKEAVEPELARLEPVEEQSEPAKTEEKKEWQQPGPRAEGERASPRVVMGQKTAKQEASKALEGGAAAKPAIEISSEAPVKTKEQLQEDLAKAKEQVQSAKDNQMPIMQKRVDKRAQIYQAEAKFTQLQEGDATKELFNKRLQGKPDRDFEEITKQELKDTLSSLQKLREELKELDREYDSNMKVIVNTEGEISQITHQLHLREAEADAKRIKDLEDGYRSGALAPPPSLSTPPLPPKTPPSPK